MGDKDIKRSATTTVRHSLDGEWSQHDFGEAFEVSSLSVIAELDPLGERGVPREVLELFLKSLEPELDRLEHLDLDGDCGKLAFEVHRLGSAAGQLGALRLAAACRRIQKHQAGSVAFGAAKADPELRGLVDQLVAEIIRVQRRLRTLLTPG